MIVRLISANRYTVGQLVEIYNQTRVDYLVPMPMSADRLAAYIHDYDVDLGGSVVALLDDEVAGLGMLGLREKRSWITRLGVLPNNRRVGIGERILEKMLENARALGATQSQLEVITGNDHAKSLFKKHGFLETGEYIVFRRAPDPSIAPPGGTLTRLDKEQALERLRFAPRQTWINEFKSMSNASDVFSINLTLDDGSHGWVIFRRKIPTLSHIILHTEHGDPAVVGMKLLAHLHLLHPRLDTYAENIHDTDAHIPAYLSLDYFEAFRRTEMGLLL
ncbi:MAG TPA: GNAT family N-acetyltransferase [Anaerolineales bacterium]|nr:GNAT family N-acetyltransferase [Anaerolineales bacterium]